MKCQQLKNNATLIRTQNWIMELQPNRQMGTEVALLERRLVWLPKEVLTARKQLSHDDPNGYHSNKFQ